MFKRLKIKLTRKFRRVSAPPDVEESSNHKTAFSIFRLALRDPKVDLLLRPVKNKRIIKLEDRGVYIILTKTMLEITNHNYSFTLEIPYDRYIKLSKLFDIKLDSMIEKEEGNIISQVHTGLSKVLETFKSNHYDRGIPRPNIPHTTLPSQLPGCAHSQS